MAALPLRIDSSAAQQRAHVEASQSCLCGCGEWSEGMGCVPSVVLSECADGACQCIATIVRMCQCWD
eukprot:COSAG06_NODE_2135_length_7516_cov_140.525819_5_plen_67_part_00